MELVFKCPINSLSFGNVSINFLKELKNKNIDVTIFPHGNADISAFDKMSEEFKVWLEHNINNRFNKVNKDIPTLNLWHLNGSENRITSKQFLYTFYELNQPTETETSLAKLQDHVFFSSTHARDCFNLENASSCPLGFDNDFHKTNKEYLSKDIIHFGLIGKFEKRKNHEQIIKAWVKKYGNNFKYRLSCLIDNPFLKAEQMNAIKKQILGNESVGNVTFLPRLKTNSEVNDLLNAIDIDLSGLSGAEGWNLPAFNSTCLGKWSIVLNNTSHKDWANESNSILINSDKNIPAYDGTFFSEGGFYNQGTINLIEEEDIIHALEKAETKAKTENPEGEKLKEKFSYSKTVDTILETISTAYI